VKKMAKRLALPHDYRDATSPNLPTLMRQTYTQLAHGLLQLLTKFDGLGQQRMVQSICLWITPANLAVRQNHMSWKTSKFASGLVSLFIDSAPEELNDNRVERVRQAMLTALQGLPDAQTLDSLTRRVRWAPHAQALWYLRVDVMTLLSTQRSEAEARQCLHEITQMFLGLVHANQMSRPSRLNQG
jgi:hypothetical protein